MGGAAAAAGVLAAAAAAATTASSAATAATAAATAAAAAGIPAALAAGDCRRGLWLAAPGWCASGVCAAAAAAAAAELANASAAANSALHVCHCDAGWSRWRFSVEPPLEYSTALCTVSNTLLFVLGAVTLGASMCLARLSWLAYRRGRLSLLRASPTLFCFALEVVKAALAVLDPSTRLVSPAFCLIQAAQGFSMSVICMILQVERVAAGFAAASSKVSPSVAAASRAPVAAASRDSVVQSPDANSPSPSAPPVLVRPWVRRLAGLLLTRWLMVLYWMIVGELDQITLTYLIALNFAAEMFALGVFVWLTLRPLLAHISETRSKLLKERSVDAYASRELAPIADGHPSDRLLALLDRTERKIRTTRRSWLSSCVGCGTVLLLLGVLAPVSTQTAPYVMSCYWIMGYGFLYAAVRRNSRVRHDRRVAPGSEQPPRPT